MRNGKWLLRIEDIDPPREQPGADELILRALQAYGFRWDGETLYQSQTAAIHDAKVSELLNHGLAYPCNCSRRDLADAPRSALGTIYPGTCRSGCAAREFAVRVRTNDEPVSFDDALQGHVTQRLESESGDFVIKRRDGLIAYHLAVVVDDHVQGISEIVRGIDLLDSTPRQIYLQKALGYATPQYLHIPVALNVDGQKLSKLTGASGLPLTGTGPVLVAALRALQQPAPGGLESAGLEEIWRWAINHWDVSVLTGQKDLAADQYSLAQDQNGLR